MNMMKILSMKKMILTQNQYKIKNLRKAGGKTFLRLNARRKESRAFSSSTNFYLPKHLYLFGFVKSTITLSSSLTLLKYSRLSVILQNSGRSIALQSESNIFPTFLDIAKAILSWAFSSAASFQIFANRSRISFSDSFFRLFFVFMFTLYQTQVIP